MLPAAWTLAASLGLIAGAIGSSFDDDEAMARGYLRSVVFFPVLVSTIGVGITFQVLMDPFGGPINEALAAGAAHRARLRPADAVVEDGVIPLLVGRIGRTGRADGEVVITGAAEVIYGGQWLIS